MTSNWVSPLLDVAGKKKLVVLRVPARDWTSIENAKNGLSSFSFALPHEEFEGITDGSICLFFRQAQTSPIRIGLITSRSAVTTVQTRIRITAGHSVIPSDINQLAELPDLREIVGLEKRLSEQGFVSTLSKTMSEAVISVLAKENRNESALKILSDLVAPRKFENAKALQADAIETALKIFGLSSNSSASKVVIPSNTDSELAGPRLLEDAVVEHDAKKISEMSLIEAAITGYAEFEREGERLRVYTANKRPLERLFGVDLIYLNLNLRNMVLVQYKMLERDNKDWIYRPDKQLDEEIARMDDFRKAASAASTYRLNPEAFYMKFVKRDAPAGSATVLMPVDHFKTLRGTGSIRISYEALNGQFLREPGFIDLIKGGYIGAHSEVTDAFEALIAEILEGGNAVVTAIQERLQQS